MGEPGEGVKLVAAELGRTGSDDAQGNDLAEVGAPPFEQV
jgi:hypothetical protein